jgi:hypothetical protein
VLKTYIIPGLITVAATIAALVLAKKFKLA